MSGRNGKNLTPSAVLEFADLDPSILKLAELSAPFPVPSTQMILLMGLRGVDLPLGDTVLSLQTLLDKAWQDVATFRYVQPVPEWSRGIHITSDLVLTVRPRMHEGRSLLTDTDLIEAAVGLVDYMLREGAHATTAALVRPNNKRRRVNVGEIEIELGQPSLKSVSTLNDSFVAMK